MFGEYTPKEILYVSSSSSVSRFTREKHLANAKYIIEKDKFEINSPGEEYKISNPIYEIKEMNEELWIASYGLIKDKYYIKYLYKLK